ncbi:hypothetical protein IWX90DRAFT_99752 [Phyllosticta citrichinensis]|uniref:BTB domain-containing protein n=1 Tax=Phyllosticta citrichinensis TaxID=1130410 RepID=A0ABR1Y1P5_9PEZI
MVGIDENKKTFLIHEDLLCRESDKFNLQLRGPFKEAKTGKIPDCEEDPAHFAFFGEYLYRDGWVEKDGQIEHSSEWVLLARLYAMGERIGAKRFQDACLWKFLRHFTRDSQIADSEVCQLLEIIVTELPERNDNENPLRSVVLWYAASKLSRLQKYSAFKNHLLNSYPDLGGQILMWAGDIASQNKPVQLTSKPASRFLDEVEFV